MLYALDLKRLARRKKIVRDELTAVDSGCQNVAAGNFSEGEVSYTYCMKDFSLRWIIFYECNACIGSDATIQRSVYMSAITW